ncbi:DUF5677 domain-containing protein [Prolixibacteraceae bacterium Z1-6]|uniref:DUF5677 domain-containing protein n=1 Tax=Draconibacterium aestuarii TaxID=2998507 RepID=A0A9X3J5A0_9BACT|nr:DUF5677 domain-containing protein [Prolixibacteraceae bacterium Z1-6]
MNKTIDAGDFNRILNKYLANINAEFLERWNLLVPTIEDKEFIEVIIGLLSRQISITHYYLSSPNTWNGDIGTIILRSICENVINISWILKDDSINRARMFIVYGLGQEKLQLEHRKNEMNNGEVSEEEIQMVEYMENSLNQEKYTFLTDVNIGSWSDKSILKIAEEADCLDFYHLAFTPFSNSAHGTWNHLIKYSLRKSSNPLHNLLRRPIFYNLEPDITFAELAMKYLSKSLRKFDNYFNQKIVSKDSYEIYLEDLENLLINKDDNNTSQ